MGKFIDLTGMKFGRLTVIERAEDYVSPKGDRIKQWHCICNCGNDEILTVRGDYLRDGRIVSCNCYRKERARQAIKKYNDYEIQEDYVIMYTSKGTPFFVDLEDFWKVKDCAWFENGLGYIKTWHNNKFVYLHRMIMDAPDGMEVDHIGGESTRNDNRKYNLRICTHRQNCMNIDRSHRSKSGVVGVVQRNNKWCVTIGTEDIGKFDSFDEAVACRKEAEEEYFGEYSYDNSQKILKERGF